MQLIVNLVVGIDPAKDKDMGRKVENFGLFFVARNLVEGLLQGEHQFFGIENEDIFLHLAVLGLDPGEQEILVQFLNIHDFTRIKGPEGVVQLLGQFFDFVQRRKNSVHEFKLNYKIPFKSNYKIPFKSNYEISFKSNYEIPYKLNYSI